MEGLNEIGAPPATSLALTWSGVRSGFWPRMMATAPVTWGAAWLVPDSTADAVLEAMPAEVMSEPGAKMSTPAWSVGDGKGGGMTHNRPPGDQGNVTAWAATSDGAGPEELCPEKQAAFTLVLCKFPLIPLLRLTGPDVGKGGDDVHVIAAGDGDGAGEGGGALGTGVAAVVVPCAGHDGDARLQGWCRRRRVE